MSLGSPPTEPTTPGIDPAIAERAERLERLAQRSQTARDVASTRPTQTRTPGAGQTRPAGTTKRTHAARSARWLSLSLSLLATVTLTVAFSLLSLPGMDQFAQATTPIVSEDSSTSTAPPATTIPTPVLSTFDGAIVATRWGPVQVRARFNNGVLEDVITLAYPDDRRTSVAINQQALPMLRAEALSAQSANVDTISGASVTSRGYVTSLQSAIDAAQAAGAVHL